MVKRAKTAAKIFGAYIFGGFRGTNEKDPNLSEVL
jgi:hypothetical protein